MLRCPSDGDCAPAQASALLAELSAGGTLAEAHQFCCSERGGGCSRSGRSVVAVARALRGDGKEAFVLVTPLGGEAALGVGVALVRLAARTPWLARDVLWLAGDAGCEGGLTEASAAWLRDYSGGREGMLRAGALTGALVLEPGEGPLELRVKGARGELPNLDVVSLSRTLAGGLLEPRLDHAGMLRAAARFLARGADGAHAAFLGAGVECATLGGGGGDALQLGRLVEGHLRSWSNLLERLHHSSAFYILLTPGQLLSPPAYLPAAALLCVAGPLLQALAGARGARQRAAQLAGALLLARLLLTRLGAGLLGGLALVPALLWGW